MRSLSLLLSMILTLSAWGNSSLPAGASPIPPRVAEVLESSELTADAKIGRLRHYLQDTEIDGDSRAVAELALLRLLFEQERFQEIIDSPSPRRGLLQHYLLYYRGRAHYRLGQDKYAARVLERVRKSKAPNYRLNLFSRYWLAKSYMRLEKWRSARQQLRYLERKIKNTPEYNDVLYDLVLVEKKSRNSWQACKWARKLYSRYPNEPLIANWNINFASVSIEGLRVDCFIPLALKKMRIRRWWLAGNEERARGELADLLKTIPDDYGRDIVEAEFRVTFGNPQKSVELLLPHHKTQGSNAEYLSQLGRAAGKVGDLGLSTYGYRRAHSLQQRSRRGRKALFNAAIINYQFQNYDMAVELLEEFKRKYPRSSQIREAEWYLGWNRYLRGDYAGAIANFDYILDKIKRRWRGWRSLQADKYRYWRAMSLLRQGERESAISAFKEIGDEKLMTYYYLASSQRLRELGVEYEPRKPASEELEAFLEAPTEEDWDDGESGSDESLNQDDVAEAYQEGIEEEPPRPFRNSNFNTRLARSLVLNSMNFESFTKWELYEIERRTSRKEYLRNLIQYYLKFGYYNRAAYLSQVYFAGDRAKFGIQGVRHLWEAAYPKAFEETVGEYADRMGIPHQLTWAIMRAETIYKVDARSPVGALGLMQVMPYTGNRMAGKLNEDFESQQLLQPDGAIRIGSAYLARLSGRFQSEIPLVAAAYNAGPHRVRSWLDAFGELDADEFIEHVPFKETRGYVKRVVRNYLVYNALYKFENEDPISLSHPIRTRWSGGIQHREAWD